MSSVLKTTKTMEQKVKRGTSVTGIYCLGFIGAAVYFIAKATGFWAGVAGFLKALVWPAFLVYEAFKYVGA